MVQVHQVANLLLVYLEVYCNSYKVDSSFLFCRMQSLIRVKQLLKEFERGKLQESKSTVKYFEAGSDEY